MGINGETRREENADGPKTQLCSWELTAQPRDGKKPTPEGNSFGQEEQTAAGSQPNRASSKGANSV